MESGVNDHRHAQQGTLEGTTDQDTNREDGMFDMTSHLQVSIFTIFKARYFRFLLAKVINVRPLFQLFSDLIF